MTLFLIGLGLADENDITLKGLRAVQSCDKVYLESYTSILLVGDFKKRMEALYGKEVTLAHRETVELEADDILLHAHKSNVAFLVVGDPLSATTHSDLILRARSFQAPGSEVPTPVDVRIIHNASITTALGSSGLAGYNFGQTISVPFWTEDWRPDSWLERIGENMNIGLHTLCLSDIKVREQSIEDMSRGIVRYQPPRYMLIPQLIRQLLAAAKEHKVDYLDPDRTLAIALCRMGAEPDGERRGEMIVAGTLGELLSYTEPTAEQRKEDEAEDEAYEEENPTASEKEMDERREARAVRRAIAFWGEPLHTLILVGSRLHPMEVAYGNSLTQPGSRWTEVAEQVYHCRT
ncbi:diphthine methyl ester synthase [Malassezia furfur]|uniref:diphthine methyl ester synthase n=1 Tax=Malassezia furfur TaxID=55194 RepID=A0ABY8ERF7_MALFU|nr:DPH5 [Malassezia furfur]WFD48176.1 diphthine methyl ester synthase [Malassezia furfur]